MSSPAPSHRSIPALGAMYSGAEGGGGGGPLRVVNSDEGMTEEERRFGGRSGGDPYGGDLTEGLERQGTMGGRVSYTPRAM